MSKNIRINEQNYNGISYISVNTDTGGTATFKDVDEISVPNGTKSITKNGTYDVASFASVDVNVESEAASVNFDDVAMGLAPSGDVVLNTATFIGIYKFMNNTSIVTFKAPKATYIDNSAFQCQSAETNLELLEIPEVTKIGNYALTYRQGLTSLTLPKVNNLGNACFSHCIGLKTIKFGSKVTTVGTTPFQGCTGLKDIYVPWAEGEVDLKAPDTATIHYNTEYDENWNVVSST